MITTMKNSERQILKVEKVGFYLSVLCAIHCIATPILITLVPFLGGSLLENHTWELWFIGGSLALAGVILYSDYKKHENTSPLSLLGLSLFIKLLEVIWLGERLEFITGSLGALLIASAYFINWKSKIKTCTC
jgi:hypothetical protein